MTIEQGLYSQVFNPRRKYFKSIAANKNKNEAKFKFHGQYARSRRCFILTFIGLKTCAYNPCSIVIHFILFLTSIGILIASFSLSLNCFIK